MAKEMSMTELTPMDEDRLARQLRAESEAVEILSAQFRPLTWRSMYGELAVIAGMCVPMLMSSPSSYPEWGAKVIYVVALMGFYAGIAAMRECVRISKRQEAALVLLMRQREQR